MKRLWWALAAILPACGGVSMPDNMAIDTPLAEITITEPEPPPLPLPDHGCYLGTDVVLLPGSTFQCGGLGPGGSTPAQGSIETPPEAETAAPNALENDARPDLVGTIRQAEGNESNFPYCDPSGLHVGTGVWVGQYLRDIRTLTESERQALDCMAIDNARDQAQRTIGITWETLEQPRRDAWIETCYAADCASFEDAITAIRGRNWPTAASEMLDSCLYVNKPGCRADSANPDRAQRLAMQMWRGEYEQ